MIQIMRFEGVPKTSTITKLLANETPNFPSGVTGFVRIAGLVSSATIIKLFYGSSTPAILSFTDADSWEDIESWNA